MKMQADTRTPVAEYNGLMMAGKFASRIRGRYFDDGGPKPRGECKWPLCPGIPPRGALVCSKYHILQDVTDPVFDVFIDAGVGWELGTVEREGTTYKSLIFDLEAMKPEGLSIADSA